jgi:hypothetical protein
MEFVDAEAAVGAEYWYRLVLRLQDGTEVLAGPVQVTMAARWTTALFAPAIAGRGQPVEVRYSLAASGTPVRLEIFDVAGRRVRLLERGAQAAGHYVLGWDRRNDAGARVVRGLYFVRLSAGDTHRSRKLLLAQD